MLKIIVSNLLHIKLKHILFQYRLNQTVAAMAAAQKCLSLILPFLILINWGKNLLTIYDGIILVRAIVVL